MTDTDWAAVTYFFNGVITESKDVPPSSKNGTGDLKVALYSNDFDQTMTVTVPASRVEDFMKHLQLFDAEVHRGTFQIVDWRDKLKKDLQVNEIIVDETLPEGTAYLTSEPNLDEYNKYLKRQREAHQPVMTFPQWNRYVNAEKKVDRAKEREFTQRNNPNKTHWVVGEMMVIDGIQFVIGRIQEQGDYLDIRLDRMNIGSSYIRVPK